MASSTTCTVEPRHNECTYNRLSESNVAIETVLQIFIYNKLSAITKLFLCHIQFVMTRFDSYVQECCLLCSSLISMFSFFLFVFFIQGFLLLEVTTSRQDLNSHFVRMFGSLIFFVPPYPFLLSFENERFF